MHNTVGFTTTIPLEVLFAAGVRPCDLNNIFVSHEDPLHYIALAEKEGFPKSMCNWIKGLYGVIRESHIDTVVTVLEGDCSNTRALAEILAYRGVRTIPFSFPYDRDREGLSREIGKFASSFGVDQGQLQAVEGRLQVVRQDLALIDRLTWVDRRVTGFENHLWQLCASDMEGDTRRTEVGLKRSSTGATEGAHRGHSHRIRGRAPHQSGPLRVRGGKRAAISSTTRCSGSSPCPFSQATSSTAIWPTRIPTAYSRRLEDIRQEIAQEGDKGHHPLRAGLLLPDRRGHHTERELSTYP